MKNILNIGLLIILILAFSGCTDNPVSDADVSLVGTWHWTKGVGFGTETPETCGCSRTIIFGEDNQYAFFYNGKMIDSGIYELKKIYNEPLDTTFTILYLGKASLDFEFLAEDEITLYNSMCLSCLLDYYKREPL
jgi:hypothetical protein